MLEGILYLIHAVLAVMLVAIGWRLIKALTRSRPPRYTTRLARDVDLPSVTVCIPARNEAHALIDCLDRVIASEYEKFEILVLDDASGDNTSALIKSYASEGVRFIQGKPLPAEWLGKNRALQGLLEHASGTYVLFMDVDTRLDPFAVEHMIRYTIAKHATMLSVLPRREDGWRMSIITSPLRYFWELLFGQASSPSTASNAWLIRRDVLVSLGGFGPLKASVQPEAKLAALLAASKAYHFLVGTKSFGVGYEKKWRSQLMTSSRLLFPMLGSQVSLAVIACIDLLLLLTPFVVLAVLWPLNIVSAPLGITAAIVAVGYMAIYGIYTHRVWRRGWLVGAALWPLLVLQEAALVIASAIKYKRQSITWKGRAIQPEAKN